MRGIRGCYKHKVYNDFSVITNKKMSGYEYLFEPNAEITAESEEAAQNIEDPERAAKRLRSSYTVHVGILIFLSVFSSV